MATLTLFFMEYFQLFYPGYSVHWGINHPSKTVHILLFLSSTPIKSTNYPCPPFLGNPLFCTGFS